jgi:hypothetical protein
VSPTEKQHFIAKGNLIPIRQAVKYTPYTSEYLGLLARKGKLKAVKISRDWLTTRDAIREYLQRQMDRQQQRHEKFLQVMNGVGEELP